MRLFARFNEIARDDASVNLIFNHIRNLGLCALVAGVGDFLLAHPERLAIASWIVPPLASILLIVACALVALNALHALLKTKLLKSKVEQVLLYLVVNAIGPLMIGALILSGPFRN